MSKGSDDSGYAHAGRYSTSEISSAHYLDLSVSLSTDRSSTALGFYSRIRFTDNRSIDSSNYNRIKEDLSSSIQTTSTGHYVILDDVGRSTDDQRYPPVRKDVSDVQKPTQYGKRPFIIGFVILLVMIVLSGVIAAVVTIFASRKETISLSSTTSPVTEKFTVESTAPRTTPTPTSTEADTTIFVQPAETTTNIPVFNNTGFHRDCKDLLANGSTSDGVYTIYPYLPTTTAVRVFCDMTTDGGGWTTFQHRRDGSVEFYLLWDSYKNGFGEASGEYWLGNDHLHQLTSIGTSDFYVRLEKFTGDWAFAKYNELTVANETDGYRLKVQFNSYQGNAGDCFQSHLTINSQGYKFSTPDVDNDFASSSCAIAHRGAWWYNECSLANLNGYYNYPNCGAYRYCNFWYSLTNSYVNVKTSYMMVRRV